MPRRESVTVLKSLTLPMTFPAEYIEDTVSGSLVPTVLPGFGNVGLPAPIDLYKRVLPARRGGAVQTNRKVVLPHLPQSSAVTLTLKE